MTTKNIKSINMDFQKFDITKMSNDSTVIIIGKRETGKTYLINDMLKNCAIPIGSVVSSKPENSYSKTVPQASIHTEYTPSIFSNMPKPIISNRPASDRQFLVVDNSFWNNDWQKDNTFIPCYVNNRAFRLLMIVSMAYAMPIDLKMRGNTDYIFVFRESVADHRRHIYDQYGHMFPTFELFCEALDQCTSGKYECMVIRNTHPRGLKLENQVFWYRAP